MLNQFKNEKKDFPAKRKSLSKKDFVFLSTLGRGSYTKVTKVMDKAT